MAINQPIVSRVRITLADIGERIKIMELSFISVVQYNFVNATLFRV